MSVQTLIQDGKLTEAIAAATSDVKQAPMKPELRLVLAELISLTGNIDRADSVVEAATKLKETKFAGLTMFRQLLRGESARSQWFQEGRPPQTRTLPTPEFTSAIQAVVEYRASQLQEAAQIINSPAESLTCPGQITLNSGEVHPLDMFRDLNDLTSTVAELISLSGKFYWVPWSDIISIKFDPATTLRDVIWRSAELTFTDGAVERYFMPSLYFGTTSSDRDSLRLGQETDWKDLGEGLTSGIGLRMFLAGEQTPTVLEIAEIQFNRLRTISAESN